MIEVTVEHARTLSAIVAAGTLEGAATHLHLTPSAVSQRLRAMERAIGRPVLHRTRPVAVTTEGAALLRFAHGLEQLARDLADELATEEPDPAPLTVVIGADSLRTWAVQVLPEVATRVALEIIREDQDDALERLRLGTAGGAVTSSAQPVPGCTVRPLGVMRYLAVCSPDYSGRWFGGVDPDVSPERLRTAPVVSFDRSDQLQRRCLRDLGVTAGPPVHYVPASAEFLTAIELGVGWGMVPEIECGPAVADGRLVPLAENAIADVPLHWQQWRRAGARLHEVGEALTRLAAQHLRRS